MSGYGITHFFSPSRVIFFSLLCCIVIGTCLLSLSYAQNSPIPFIDTLFVATSALCVTGLSTISIHAFSGLGKTIILILIQIGGLGIITLTLFVASLILNLGMGTKMMAEELLDVDTWSNTKKLLIFIIIATIAFESIGALFIFSSLKQYFPLWQALGYSLFQSISAFCNAGVSLLDYGHPLFSEQFMLCNSMGFLMILGGIGFLTIKEIIKRLNPLSKEPKKICFSLQTKIALFYYLSLTGITTLAFWCIEKMHALKDFSFIQQGKIALFTAITARSGGFLVLKPELLQPQSFLLLTLNGLIGAAPGSTGSGLKLTTFAILIASTYAVIQSKESVEISGRSIAKDQILKALSVLVLSVIWVFFATFCILYTDPQWPFMRILVEITSAFSTLGISTGITPLLSEAGKCILIVTMFIGRISPLTLIIACKMGKKQREFSYPEERVMIS